MTATLAALTIRALLNRRRTLLLVLLAALIVVVAALFRLSDPSPQEASRFTGRLLADFGLAVLLPLVSVIVGTATIGSELDDGTIIYLLSKPIARVRIGLVKLVVAWLVTILIVVPAILLAGLVGNGGDSALGLAYAVAAVVGALEYTAIFAALSLVTSRALVVGLAYVVIWEGVIAGLFAGTRTVSVRQHALAIADAFGAQGSVSAALELGTAVTVTVVVTLLAAALMIRRLQGVELRGETP
ncbi:MAG TPA: ABC transporter permease [Candidatus Limnocylindria bacterium]|nr:ABC transporter permease [Candidatus Limnocylindria bacterium]